jgi:N6-adenosine-specific RNA methylase IME4
MKPGTVDIVYADPPWPYYGSTEKDAAAGKHYDLMSMDDIFALPVKALFRDPKHGAAFVWATCPKLDDAVDTIRRWGLHYRGVAFVWVKTRKDGGIIGAQGVPPTGTKPTTELCLLATTCRTGRPFPLLDAKVAQVVLAPRGRHSEKPPEVRDRIVSLYGDRPRIELFARTAVPGWERWGNEAPE